MKTLRDIRTKTDFKIVTDEIIKARGYRVPEAFGLGLAHIGRKGQIIAVRFPCVNRRENSGSAAVFKRAAAKCKKLTKGNDIITYLLDSDALYTMEEAFKPYRQDRKTHSNIRGLEQLRAMKSKGVHGNCEIIAVFNYDLQQPVSCTSDAYLRLHLLSMGKLLPQDLHLKGLRTHLTKCAWTDNGPVEAEYFEEVNHNHVLEHGVCLRVESVHELPSLLDYVVSPKVNVINRNTRLGAHWSTTKMLMSKELKW